MYQTLVWDEETESAIEFWWSDSMAQALVKEAEFRAKYQDKERYGIFSELHTGPHATIDDACGY